jgi:hypothetical protein
MRREGLLKYQVNIDGLSRLVHVDHLHKRTEQVQTAPGSGIVVNVSSDQNQNVPIDANLHHAPDVPNDVNMPNVPIDVNVQNAGNVPNEAIVPNGLPPESRRNPPRERKAPERLIETM